MPRRLARGCLLAGCLLAPCAAGAQSRPICPEYRDPLPARTARPPERAAFRPSFERATPRGAALAQTVRELFAKARGSVHPRDVLDEIVFAAEVDVNSIRNDVQGEPWAERVTEAQLARVEHYRDRLREIDRGERSWAEFVGELRHLSPRLLLSCPETLRGRRVSVVGDVEWERRSRPPHDVVRLVLTDGGVRLPLVWAGTGPVAEIDEDLFGRWPAVHSWWRVSVEPVNGRYVVYLHDFLGMKGRPAAPGASRR